MELFFHHSIAGAAMSAAVEYNWNVEYKKDKRLKEMKDACYQMLARLKIAETSAKEASASTTRIVLESTKCPKMAASPSDLNDMLVHVASCPSMEEPCVHPTHKDHCSFVKNLLRCAAMLSVQLQGTKVASQLALALGYHAAHCHGAHFCHVPHCNDANRRKHVHPGVQPLNLDEDEEGDD
ncbi:hypothetical protein DYB37_000647 [Aphanomyces astaci]|uniref:TAZ-type domain-containing protein n=1 Tax=Aphanomyces astaci TaxID=112090 RepID=A0A3R6XY38_APHAT|nr:hypothetical protein DYB35_002365 [Aphanomyces astaci]RHZ25308.1 hypothetical protein DYB37_000647 [Aphanomyces astaci]